MPKQINTIKQNIMSKIQSGDIKMRSRIYFVIGYVFTILGIISSITTSMFFIGLMRFTLRSHGPMGQYRLDKMLSEFSWCLPFFALSGLILGIYLLKKYDFSYKYNFKSIIAGLLIAVIVSGVFIDIIGINDLLIKKGRKWEQRKFQNKEINPRPR